MVPSVDLLIPLPPMPVPVAGTTRLVYELHLTNFLSVDVALSRLSVIAGADTMRSIEIRSWRSESSGPGCSSLRIRRSLGRACGR